MPIRLLIADNEEFILRLLQATFRNETIYEVQFARSGAEALRLSRERPPQVAILDANMPGGSGYAVCQELKRAPETAQVRVIIITGEHNDEGRVRAAAAGADGFLLKPFYPHAIRDLANRLVSESQAPPD